MTRKAMEEILRQHLAKAITAGKDTEQDRLEAILDAMKEVGTSKYFDGYADGQESVYDEMSGNR
jgi:hypothetical protein